MEQTELEAIWQRLQPTDEELRAADEAVGVVVFLTGAMEDGVDFYAYASILPSKLAAFMSEEKKGEGYTLTDYGEVLMSGGGKYPPAYVVDYMQTRYGIVADPDTTLDEYLLKEFKKFATEDEIEAEKDKERALRDKYGLKKRDE
jgi:hypothetical protein